jgi:hypothetical protein
MLDFMIGLAFVFMVIAPAAVASASRHSASDDDI